MTLCISYINRRHGEYAHGFALSDSQLTGFKSKEKKEESAAFVPSNVDANFNPHGIKVHVVNQTKFQKRDFVISLAGAISLGQQAVGYLKSLLEFQYHELNFRQTQQLIFEAFHDFWQKAYDREFESLFLMYDDFGTLRLFKLRGTKKFLTPVVEIESDEDIVVGTIGDRAKEIRDDILQSIVQIRWAKPNVLHWVALEVSSIRALRKEIEDYANPWVGGTIQAACIRSDKGAFLMPTHYNEKNSYMGLVHGEKIDPVKIPIHNGPVWGFGSDNYDPQKPLSEIVDQLFTSS